MTLLFFLCKFPKIGKGVYNWQIQLYNVCVLKLSILNISEVKKMELIGLQNVEYEKDGKRIVGTRLFFTYEDDRVNGIACESVYVSGSVDLPELKIGDVCEILYNKYGRVSGIRIVG